MNKTYNFLIVGAGLFGSICAYELTQKGYSVLVVEKRDHIGGNCFTSLRDGIHIHNYGPHIFHTANKRIWDWINQFATFNNFILNGVANYKGEIYSLPFNMWTFSKLWNITHPDDAKRIIYEQSKHVKDPKNFEETAIKMVGTDVYNKLIKGYTLKQWQKDPKLLPSQIIKRIPVRFTYNNNYFTDQYQGIPIGGYTNIFEQLLRKVEVRLNTDFLKNKEKLIESAQKVIYTGPIDAFFDYRFGHLEYRTTKFIHARLSLKDYQGTAMMNYTSQDVPFTRCIEHKHFEYANNDISWITQEFPEQYLPGSSEPYYPINDEQNNTIYSQYKQLAKSWSNIFFGGRLGEYKYYDMHQVIGSALSFVDTL